MIITNKNFKEGKGENLPARMSFAGVSASGLQIPGTNHCNVSVLSRPAAWLCPLQEDVELLACGKFIGSQQQRYGERNDGSVSKNDLAYTSNLNRSWCK